MVLKTPIELVVRRVPSCQAIMAVTMMKRAREKRMGYSLIPQGEWSASQLVRNGAM
jgi:hypothetical protein